eukprot:sb/3477196/
MTYSMFRSATDFSCIKRQLEQCLNFLLARQYCQQAKAPTMLVQPKNVQGRRWNRSLGSIFYRSLTATQSRSILDALIACSLMAKLSYNLYFSDLSSSELSRVISDLYKLT